MKIPHYVMTCHVCRHCGNGRILQQTNSGITGGGNAIYRCATCGIGAAAICTSAFCYCNTNVACHDPSKPVPDGWYVFKRLYNLQVIMRSETADSP